MTNICSEITLHTDESHSFVCCLSSLNISRYEEWKNTNLIYDAIWFLDGVLEEFIQKAKGKVGFANSVRSAEKGRALGLGVLGWHTYLQKNGIPFEGLTAQYETRREYLARLKSNLNERVEISLNFMVNLFGALALGFVTLILGLLLLLCLIVSLPVMLVLVLSLGPLMFSLNKVRRVRSLGRTKSSKSLKKSWVKY